MGSTIRKYNALRVCLQRQIRAKCEKIAPLMQPGFADEEFIKVFGELFPTEWKEIEGLHGYYRQKDKTRQGRKFRFPTPRYFILGCSKSIRNAVRRRYVAGFEFNAVAANEIRSALEKRKIKKTTKLAEIEMLLGERTQQVFPDYLSTVMARYRHSSPAERLLSVKELGKYNIPYTQKSLYQILAGEEDYFIRQEAFFLLQKFGCVVFLPKKGRGRKKKKDNLLREYGNYTQDIGRSPSNIMVDIASGSIESMKKYHIFLSHNSRDRKAVLDLVSRLNLLGYVVYVDWISDREDMDRTKSNTDTAMVLLERIRQSDALMILRSGDGPISPWMAWELGFYQASGKKICLFNASSIESCEPEFLRIHPKVLDIEGDMFIESAGQRSSLQEWLS